MRAQASEKYSADDDVDLNDDDGTTRMHFALCALAPFKRRESCTTTKTRGILFTL